MAQQWAAGERIVADKLSTQIGEPVIRSANGTDFTTTEVVLDTIVVPVVTGRRYKVVWDGGFSCTVASQIIRCRLREDSVTGTDIQLRQCFPPVVNQVAPVRLEQFYTAVSTGNKTFVATAHRLGGSGTVTPTGAGAPVLFYVDNS